MSVASTTLPPLVTMVVARKLIENLRYQPRSRTDLAPLLGCSEITVYRAIQWLEGPLSAPMSYSYSDRCWHLNERSWVIPWAAIMEAAELRRAAPGLRGDCSPWLDNPVE